MDIGDMTVIPNLVKISHVFQFLSGPRTTRRNYLYGAENFSATCSAIQDLFVTTPVQVLKYYKRRLFIIK